MPIVPEYLSKIENCGEICRGIFHFIEGLDIIFMSWKTEKASKYEQIVNMPKNGRKIRDFRIFR